MTDSLFAPASRIALLALSLLLISASGNSTSGSTISDKAINDNGTEPPLRATRVVVEKSRHLLTVYAHEKPLLVLQVALGREPVGPKTCAGDRRTPEGLYFVRRHKPNSGFYRALELSYPATADIARARQQHCDPGGSIMIHGLENGYDWVGRTHRSIDWTNGCVAVTNEEMDQLWTLVKDGTIVEIRP